jgi:uroporphyrinogen decarboxylase
MNGREKVINALEHNETSSIPKFIWYHPDVKRRLADKLNIFGDNLNAELGNDLLQDWVSINREMERELPQGKEFIDEWGISWKRDGFYNMVIKHPLENCSKEEIAIYPLPDPLEKERFKVLEELIENYGKTRFIGADCSGSIFEPSYHLRNMEKLMLDMASGYKEAEILFDRLTEFTQTVAVESLKRGADWVWLGDDIGTQQGMIMSPQMWRRYLKPRMKRIIDHIRAYKSNSYIAYHSCGSMYQVIGDLVELGIDALNPIQPKATGMDAFKIKEEFGSKLTLVCGIDTQEFIVKATPEKVRKKTEELIDKLGQGGGYIFAVSHTLQPDVPLENISAMLEVLRSFE